MLTLNRIWLLFVTALLTLLACGELYAGVGNMEWLKRTESAGWGGRTGHAAAVFDADDGGERLWFLGGGFKNDVWSTRDGAKWVQHIPEPVTEIWEPRSWHGAAVFDPDGNGKRLWVMGGLAPSVGNMNDVWSSADGVTWIKHEPVGPIWTPRNSHGVAVFDPDGNGERLWVMGGGGGANRLNDVWSSSDGVNWTQHTPSGPMWSGRSSFTLEVFANQLWIMGGLDGPSADDTLDEIWSSPDGVSWTQRTPVGPVWSPRYNHASAAFDGRLWVLAGNDGNGMVWPGSYRLKDFWSSPDGVTWTQHTPWDEEREDHAIAVFEGALLVLGGGDDWTWYEDVWVYGDGESAEIISMPVMQVFAEEAYTYEFTVSGDPTPEVEVGGLPDWLQLVGNTLVGTPAKSDLGLTGTITITASNIYGTFIQVFQIEVLGETPPYFTSEPVTRAVIGWGYRYTVTAEGGPVELTLSVGPLPDWLDFDPVSGELSGTPPLSALGEFILIEITATNGWPPDAVQSFLIHVEYEPSVDKSLSSSGGCNLMVGSAGGVLLLTVLIALLGFRRRRRAIPAL